MEHQMRSLFKVSRITYSPNTTTNKKPALGGLEKAQALRSFLMASSDSSPAMMPNSHSGLVGTGVATVGSGGTGSKGVALLLAAEAALVPTPFVAVTENV